MCARASSTRLREFEGRFLIVPLPNITHVFYGRDVGYAVERIELDSSTEAVSATEVRQRLSGHTTTGHDH